MPVQDVFHEVGVELENFSIGHRVSSWCILVPDRFNLCIIATVVALLHVLGTSSVESLVRTLLKQFVSIPILSVKLSLCFN